MRAVLLSSMVAVLVATVPGMGVAQDEETVQALDSRLSRIERVLDQSLLDQLQRIDGLQREIRELRGEVERLGNDVQTLEKRNRALNADTDRRVTDLEAAREAGAAFGAGPDGLDGEPGDLADGSAGPGSGLDETRSSPGGGGQSNAGPGRGRESAGGPNGQDARGDQGGQVGQIGKGDRRGQGGDRTIARNGEFGSPGVFVGAGGASGAGRAGGTPLADFSDGPKPPAGPLRETATQAEKSAYTQAYDLLARGQNEPAVESFDAFLRKFPDGPYSDNAWYWQGEAMYAARRFDDAIRNFSVVVDSFPTSTKVPDARLKVGYSLYEQGDYARARPLLTEVQDDYPGRSAAVLARKRLQQMDREGR